MKNFAKMSTLLLSICASTTLFGQSWSRTGDAFAGTDWLGSSTAGNQNNLQFKTGTGTALQTRLTLFGSIGTTGGDLVGDLKLTNSVGPHLIFNHTNGFIDWGSGSSGNLHFRKLSTQGNVTTGTDLMTILNNGNVGIGTTAPKTALHVNGQSLWLTGGNGSGSGWPGAGPGLRMYMESTTLNAYMFAYDYSTNQYKNIYLQSGGGAVTVGTTSPNANVRLEVKNSSGDNTYGIISVGTTGKSKSLSVFHNTTENFLVYADGTVYARELWVKVGVLGDFVFEPDYKLMSLYDLEGYLKVHKHLPNIPSEKEVQEKNLNVGEMQALQLQKIEELTLYIIQLQKQIDELKKK